MYRFKVAYSFIEQVWKYQFDLFARIGFPRSKIERYLFNHPKSFYMIRIQMCKQEIIDALY